MIPIYEKKTRVKILVAALALLIGAATVVYTNLLVQRVSEREQQQIQLYAKAQQFIVNSETDINPFVFDEIINGNTTIPVILTDGTNVVSAKNVAMPPGVSVADSVALLSAELAIMKEKHPPILVKLGAGQVNYIYYRDSQLLRQLRTYPLVQLVVIGCLAIIAYFAFSASRRAEQNRVWVGLAKETAHQLGTPLSSLVGWQSYLRESDRFRGEPIVEELGKDIRRLEIITERFSNIGSVPVLKDENLLQSTRNAIEYLQSRVSKKVVFKIESDLPMDTPARINVPLFDWVIENICKNAVDAMDGRGSITLHLRRVRTRRTWYRRGAPPRQVAVDITDTGKGIPKNKMESVFMPGYTTKKRGWGLGLALAKRIIENYHEGKLFVKWSEMGRGTTFRVVLNQ
ncbi:ATP-binding protein [Hymenobacter properus]|uniref:histidine kinase n=1 Tax=Hymenobacter properus TaxID=2791026 RepID=A0A931FMA7_9BACT|nr:HAMP domain-containing sensor histidine kinase [Hymenobacter properus]MBF9141494.1 HAMP domain-containing histidine kinase [Hymenobacter properus]MBR7720303.1 HAMP domain-containing histidine kinase [Microvirga sp. SRT04]